MELLCRGVPPLPTHVIDGNEQGGLRSSFSVDGVAMTAVYSNKYEADQYKTRATVEVALFT